MKAPVGVALPKNCVYAYPGAFAALMVNELTTRSTKFVVCYSDDAPVIFRVKP